LLWSYAASGSIEAGPTVDVTGVVYVASTGGKLLALNGHDAMTSRLRWELSLGGAVRTTPVIGASGSVLVGADDDLLRSIGSHTTTCPAGLVCGTFGPSTSGCVEDGVLAPQFKTPPACGAGDSCPTGGTCFLLPGGDKACHIPCIPSAGPD
jgi:hypothetical protein